MSRLLAVVSLSLLTVFVLTTQASALPPDPTNTCGGSGMCATEAVELEHWQSACSDAVRSAADAADEYELCMDLCTLAGFMWQECYDTSCDVARDEYEFAIIIADLWCGEQQTAQDRLVACISQGCD